MSFIWDKGGSDVDERILRFSAGEDVVLDRVLFLYDVRASRAHVEGLRRIDVLSEEEAQRLDRALEQLAEEFTRGEFVLDERFEDGHSAIEVYLTEKLGEVGRKVHTGRSRNDQVLVATRLYIRDALGQLHELCRQTAEAFLDRAEAEMSTPMPGYTHMQRAVPSSVGMWLAAFAEAFVDDAELTRMTAKWVDANPLGTAAGYGVNLPLDRNFTTRELGFERMQINPIYAQNSRGKFELQVLSAFAQPLLDVRRFAWDLSLFTTREFAFVDLPDAYTTGSSIMPNKRNPDVVELLRAAWGVVEGAHAEMVSLLSLPSGYHRDLQNSKPPILRATRKGLEAMSLLPNLVENLSFDRARMKNAINAEMHATDRAIELTSEGLPFRDAYRRVAKELDQLEERKPEDSLVARTSPGGAADPRLDVIRRRLEQG